MDLFIEKIMLWCNSLVSTIIGLALAFGILLRLKPIAPRRKKYYNICLITLNLFLFVIENTTHNLIVEVCMLL
jgi:hypothetical protein